MTNETGLNRSGRFVTCAVPWLLGGVMLAVYLSTLYHQVTTATLGRLAQVAGWDWGPKYFGPVTYLVTLPVQWLPDHFKLPALNFFAAVCAALTLVLLARSVALLPHDRTNEQRLRETSEFSLLSIRSAWLPPLFAVLVCGLQLSFWERAVEFRSESYADDGEIFNLLLFAYLVRCLLEYRLDGKDSWFTRFALVYGLSMANNWAMFAFFPLFLIAVIWTKGFDFFHWRFVTRLLICGLAGVLLLLLLPLLDVLQHTTDASYGKIFGEVLRSEKLALLHLPPDKKSLLVFSFTSIFPVFLISIRWGSSFGDNSPMGVKLATLVFNVGHAFLLLCCLWVCFDPPFSPRETFGLVAFLPLYYLGALSVGYFSGYLLLVFGVGAAKSRYRQAQSASWAGRCVALAVWLLAIVTPVILVARNLPQIQTGRNLAAASGRYFSRVIQTLPPKGAVVMADIEDVAMLFQLQAAQARSGSQADDIFIETSGLSDSWDYLRRLEKKYPQAGFSPALMDTNADKPSNLDCIHLLERLSANHEIYYLHPSFGYYFERFYPEFHGVVYQLKICPTNDWLLPAAPPDLMRANRAFWKDAWADMELVARVMHEPANPDPPEALRRFVEFAHLPTETNRFAADLGKYYSRALNNWGVELQKSAPPSDTNVWHEAGEAFDLAQQLNPDNSPVRANLEFNQQTLGGMTPGFRPVKELEQKLGSYRQWYDNMNNGGPFDEPNFCVVFGAMLRKGNNFRQAIQQFERQHELMPADPGGSLLIADTLLHVLGHPDMLYYAYPSPDRTALAAAKATDETLRLQPKNTNALYLKTWAYVQLGAYLQSRSNADASSPTFTDAYSNSLQSAAELLSISPNEPNALTLQSLSYMGLSNFNEAIGPLTSLITISSNPVAVLNRGICYFRADKFDAAQADYKEVLKSHPEAYQAYYGLGEIAYRTKDFPTARTNYELYESNAPPIVRGGIEFQQVDARLKELRNGAP